MSDEKKQVHIGLSNAQMSAIANSTVDPILLAEGFEIIRQEKESGFREAFRNHWRALLWGMVLSIALVMDGYDGSIVGSFYALPSFIENFGTADGKGGYFLNPNIMTAISYVGIPGGFVGLWLCGWGQTRFGSRKTYLVGMFAVICIVFLFVFCQNLPMLLVAQALAACAWAVFNTLSAAYAAEVCPIQLRGYATSFISMCWGMGSFLAAGVNRGALTIDGNWGWRMAYAIQWAYPVPLFIAAWFAPESPWWLVRNNRIEEAKQTLRRTASPGYWDNRNIDAYIAVIQHTDEIERAESQSGSFWDLWKGTNLRRTEIMMGLWATQVWSGTAMTSLATVFFKNAGMSTIAAFNLNIVVQAMNLIGCGIEFFLMRKWGRRPLIIAGLIFLGLCLFGIGICGSVVQTQGAFIGIGVCATLINLVYHATVGPLTYTVASEIPSGRVRAKSIAWGRAFYSINYNVTAQLQPRFISEVSAGGWGWGSKTAFFWLGGNLGVTLWSYFRLPETKGFSFPELDILFANKISARKFTSVTIHDEAVDPANDKFQAEHVEDKADFEQVESARPVATLT